MASIGLRHVHLLVAEHARAIAFYRDVFGMEERFRDGPIVFIGTPGGGDSLALHLASTDEERERVGQQGGWEHFGIVGCFLDADNGSVSGSSELIKDQAASRRSMSMESPNSWMR